MAKSLILVTSRGRVEDTVYAPGYYSLEPSLANKVIAAGIATFSQTVPDDYGQRLTDQDRFDLGDNVTITVKSVDQTSQPSNPTPYDRYFVPATNTWPGNPANLIGAYIAGEWVYYSPKVGWQIFNEDDDKTYAWNGSALVVSSGGGSTGGFTASRAMVSNGSGDLAVSAVTSTELGRLSGVTSAIQTQLDGKAPLASPVFTGNPEAPTQLVTDSSSYLATTAFVHSVVANVIENAPGALDTLNELAAALGDDANFAGSVTTSLAGKASTTLNNLGAGVAINQILKPSSGGSVGLGTASVYWGASYLQVFDRGGQTYNVEAYSVPTDGTTDGRTALNTLVNTTISGQGKLLVKGTIKLSSNMTIPANVSIDPNSTGTLRPDNGVRLTILGPIPEEARQFFSNCGPGQGIIDLEGNYAVKTVLSEWFGGGPGLAASVNTPAIKSALAAAYGTNRVNGSDLQKYNRRFGLLGKYQINGTLQPHHMHGFVWEALQKMGCGFLQTAANTPILDAESVTNGEFVDILFETNQNQTADEVALVKLNYTGAQGSDLRVQNVRFNNCKFLGNNVAKIGIWLCQTAGAQGDNVSFMDCYASGFTFAAGVLGGNNTSPLTNSQYASNAINVVWERGDIQSCKNGLLAFGGNWIVESTTVENQSAQTFTGGAILADGVDFYSEAAIRGFTLRNVVSESYRIAAGDNFIMENVRQQGIPSAWYSAGYSDLAESVAFVGQMVCGSLAGMNGKMYEVTSITGDNKWGGLTKTTATGGSATTLVQTGAGWDVNEWQNKRVSVISGAGKYLTAVVASNTADTITVSAWSTYYPNVTATAPANGDEFVIEPNWGTETTSGNVTFAERDFFVLNGNQSGADGSFKIDGLYMTYPGKVKGAGEFHNVNAMRADWLQPASYILDDTAPQSNFENCYAFNGPAGELVHWSPRRNHTSPEKYRTQKQLGGQPIVWSAGQPGGGVSFLDLWIQRGDGIAHNDANAVSRNVLAYQGMLGRKSAFGTDQAGLPTQIQGGLSTGSGSPGAIEFWIGAAGGSGSSINVGSKALSLDASKNLVFHGGAQIIKNGTANVFTFNALNSSGVILTGNLVGNAQISAPDGIFTNKAVIGLSALKNPKLDVFVGTGDGTMNEASGFRLRSTTTDDDTRVLQFGISHDQAGGQNQGYGFIQFGYWGGSQDNPLILQPKAGQIGIGTTFLHDWRLAIKESLAVASPTNAGDTRAGRIVFNPGGYTAETAWIAGHFDKTGWYEGMGLVFATISGGDVSGSDAVERLRITSDGPVIHTVEDAATNALTTLHTARHNTSGTAAAGFGTRFLYQLESTTNMNQAAAAVDVFWTTATHLSRAASIAFGVYSVTDLQEGLKITADAGGVKLGFYGGAAAAKPAAYTQTYATADKTHANFTSADLATTAATQTTPWGFASQAQADDIATQFNLLRDDVEDLKQLVNAIIDDLQSVSLVG